jgi:hypothetical protein
MLISNTKELDPGFMVPEPGSTVLDPDFMLPADQENNANKNNNSSNDKSDDNNNNNNNTTINESKEYYLTIIKNIDNKNILGYYDSEG